VLSERLGDNGKIVLVPAAAAAAVAFVILSNSVFTVPTVLSERLGDNGKIVLVPAAPAAAAAFVILSNAMLSLNLSSAEISLPLRSIFGELDAPAEEEFGGGISNGNAARA
jgi:multisubunit Na+/H+ antiporter MnhE subunit